MAGKIDKAIAHTLRTVELAPDFSKGRNSLGGLFFVKSEFHETKERFEESLARKPCREMSCKPEQDGESNSEGARKKGLVRRNQAYWLRVD